MLPIPILAVCKAAIGKEAWIMLITAVAKAFSDFVKSKSAETVAEYAFKTVCATWVGRIVVAAIGVIGLIKVTEILTEKMNSGELSAIVDSDSVQVISKILNK